jgi:ribonuclease P protein component
VSDARFKPANRLLEPEDFERVFKNNPVRSADESLTLLSVPNSLGYPRLGLAISKKNIKSAAARNRVKRIIRDSFRRHKQELDGLDIVVMARVGADNKNNRELFTSLSNHWQRVVKQCKKSC